MGSVGGFGYCQGIILIGLMALSKGIDGQGGQNLGLMAEGSGNARPVVGCGAGFKGNQSGLLVGEKLTELVARQFFAEQLFMIR